MTLILCLTGQTESSCKVEGCPGPGSLMTFLKHLSNLVPFIFGIFYMQ